MYLKSDSFYPVHPHHLVQATLTSHLDYYNSLLFSLQSSPQGSQAAPSNAAVTPCADLSAFVVPSALTASPLLSATSATSQFPSPPLETLSSLLY